MSELTRRLRRNKWAPISGTMEPTDADALATALRELGEGTGLTRAQVTLIRRGVPYTYSDASLGRRWTIQPFAFALKPEACDVVPRLEWEHEAYDWFDPADVARSADAFINGGYTTVPRLADSLRRVWFELDLGPEAASWLRHCRHQCSPNSPQSSPGQMQRMLFGVAKRLDAFQRPRWWRNLRLAAWHLLHRSDCLPDRAEFVEVLAALDVAHKVFIGCERSPDGLRGLLDAANWEMSRMEPDEEDRGQGDEQSRQDRFIETHSRRFFDSLYD